MKPLDQFVHDLGLPVLGGFLGSAVAVFAYSGGLTVRQQVGATLAGGLTASFASWAVQDWLHLSAAVAGGVSFGIGLLAYRATPALTKGVVGILEGLPADAANLFAALADRIRTLGGGSK